MKNRFFVLGLILFITGALFTFTGCQTTPAEPAEEPAVTEPEVAVKEDKKPEIPAKEPEKLVEKVPEVPPEPANIVFAKELQKLLSQGKVEEAINLFDSIPDELKDDLDLKLILASLYVSGGYYDMAIKTADEVLAIDSGNLTALEIKTLCAKAKGDTSVYKAAANQILANDPYNVQVNLMQGDDQALNHKWKLARDAYTKALKGDPTNEDALYGYAKMTYYMDDLKLAKSTCQTILDKNPQNAEALSLMGKLAAEEYNYVRAIKLTQDALLYDPDNYDYYLDLGTYYRFQGKYSEAVKNWDKAVEILPEYFLAYAYLAGIYDEQEKFDQALYNYRMVIETNPDYYYAYESTAILEYHFGNYNNARSLFDKAYEYSGNYSYKLMNIAMYLKEGNKEAAKKIANALMKTLDRESTEYNMARLFVDNYSKNAESALVNKINKEDNSNKRGKMLFYMGLFCEVNGSFEMAKEYYSKVTALQAPMFFEYRLAEWGLGL